MNEKRLIDIEVKLAHQERTIADLNRAVTDQQAQLNRLEQLCRSVAERLRALAQAVPEARPEDERPPHY